MFHHSMALFRSGPISWVDYLAPRHLKVCSCVSLFHHHGTRRTQCVTMAQCCHNINIVSPSSKELTAAAWRRVRCLLLHQHRPVAVALIIASSFRWLLRGGPCLVLHFHSSASNNSNSSGADHGRSTDHAAGQHRPAGMDLGCEKLLFLLHYSPPPNAAR